MYASRMTFFNLLFVLLLYAQSSSQYAAANDMFPVIDEQMRQTLRKSLSGPYGFEDHIAAKVWLSDMSNRLKKTLPDEEYRLNLLKTIHSEATRAGIQPELVLSVIQVESNFDQFALSESGARGLMQIMPFWIKEIGHPGDNLFIPEINIRYGTSILKYYLDRERGNTVRALARYNGSAGSFVYPQLVYSALRTRWFQQ